MVKALLEVPEIDVNFAINKSHCPLVLSVKNTRIFQLLLGQNKIEVQKHKDSILKEAQNEGNLDVIELMFARKEFSSK